MSKMTTYERFKRMYEHKEADRIPIYDFPWETTMQRWYREGLPEGVSFAEYFDLDHIAHIYANNGPLYEEVVLEETEEYQIHMTSWGATVKDFKHETSTPEFLDFKIKDWEAWAEAKSRMIADPARIPWDNLKKNYKNWRENGHWVLGDMTFGFNVAISWMVGTERFLMAMIEDPDWCADILNHTVDVNLKLMEYIWDAGYEFDCITWGDDMGYKGTQFFSNDLYRRLIKPAHKRAADWAHNRGIKAYLHSCGNINGLMPELMEIGIDGLNPLEVKAGMDPIHLKKQYGDRLVFHGGINALLWDDKDAIEAEIRRIVPVMKESGGYIFASDHSIPDTVSFENMKNIIKLVKELGSYEG